MELRNRIDLIVITDYYQYLNNPIMIVKPLYYNYMNK